MSPSGSVTGGARLTPATNSVTSGAWGLPAWPCNLSARCTELPLGRQERIDTGMKFLFRHFLLLGVILGLVGQSVAFASSPCAVMQKEEVSAIAGISDCVMDQRKTDKGSTPCKEIMPGCLAMAGCGAVVAVDSVTAQIEAPLLVARLDVWPATSVLDGRSITPDPDPPSLFG